MYRSDTVNSNTVNSKFDFIRSKTLPTNDFELTVPDLYWHNIDINRSEFYHSFAEYCPIRHHNTEYIELEPYDNTDDNCPSGASRTDEYVRFQVLTGSCPEDGKCRFNTIIKLSILTWRQDYIGSVFLTCTKNGWFPPKLKHYHDRNGKYKLQVGNG